MKSWDKRSRQIKQVLTLWVLLTLLPIIGLLSCDNGEEASPPAANISTEVPSFGIYLEDSGELVLSEQHIEGYYRDTNIAGENGDAHAIELNEAGIEKWNSYMTYESIPKLKETLFSRNFILKIDEKEIYRGKFYSMVSSASYDGIVILDALIKLDEEHNRIFILSGYPSSLSDSNKDLRNSPEIISLLDELGLLK